MDRNIPQAGAAACPPVLPRPGLMRGPIRMFEFDVKFAPSTCSGWDIMLQHPNSPLSEWSLCVYDPQKKCWVDGSAKEQAATEPPKAPPRSSAASLAASSGPNSNEATGPSTAVDSGPGSAGTVDGRCAVASRPLPLLCTRCMHCTLCCQCQAVWPRQFCSILNGHKLQLWSVQHIPSAPWMLHGGHAGPGFAGTVAYQSRQCWLSSVFYGAAAAVHLHGWLCSTWDVTSGRCCQCVWPGFCKAACAGPPSGQHLGAATHDVQPAAVASTAFCRAAVPMLLWNAYIAGPGRSALPC